MPFRGNTKKIASVARSIQKLSDVPDRAARAVAEDISEFIQDEFDGGADPYGRAWADLTESTLKRRPYRGFPPLTDSGDLRDSVEVTPVKGRGVVIKFVGGSRSAESAGFHQFGTENMVARRILPNNGLPALWREALSAAVKKAVRQ